MITISTKTFDPNGHIQLRPDSDSDVTDLARRVSRTATLDGGATFTDFGFSWSDVDLQFRFTGISKADADLLGYLCRNYGQVIVTNEHGAFLALIESFVIDAGRADLKLLIIEEAS